LNIFVFIDLNLCLMLETDLNLCLTFLRGTGRVSSRVDYCQQLGELSTTAIVELLVDAKETLDGYPADLTIDSLNLEMQLPTPEATGLLNLQERDTHIGELFDIALNECAKFLSRDVPDDSGTSDILMLRDLLLDERALTLNVTDFSFAQDGVLWKKEDKLTD
jgi:hypothetical protein